MLSSNAFAESSEDTEADRTGGGRSELQDGHGGGSGGFRARQHALHRYRGVSARVCFCVLAF